MNKYVRAAELEDLDRIQELSVLLSEKEAEEFDSTIDPGWNTTEEAESYFRERIEAENGFALVAEEEGELVGYAIGGLRKTEDYRDDLDLAEMETMYLLPDSRGRGIGTRFMKEFDIWAEEHGADRVRVEVTAQNEAGHRFYQKNGLEDYAITLEKDL